MTVVSLDQIVRNFILKRRYSLHWYCEFMVAAKDCLREISMDSLRSINTKLLPVNETNAIELPNDYLDYSRVGVRVGQNIRPLVETDKINSLVNRDANFDPIRYDSMLSDTGDNQLIYAPIYPLYWRMVSWNQFGEPTGRFFGIGAGAQDDTFKVIQQRNQIQLTELLSVDSIVLEYISDGGDADSATKITSYAYATIDAYIMWQMKENTRTYSEGEKQRAQNEFIKQHKILRARVSKFTLEVLKRIVQKASYGAPKS